jgi:hypothetical protein
VRRRGGPSKRAALVGDLVHGLAPATPLKGFFSLARISSVLTSLPQAMPRWTTTPSTMMPRITLLF